MRDTADILTLASLIKAFFGMNHQCLTNFMQERGLNKVSNPRLLFFIRSKGGVIPQKDIAEYLGVAPPTIAVSVKRMEKAGLLRKKANQDDQRENYIELTEKGMNLAKESMKAFDEYHSALLDGLSEEDVEVFSGFLIRIIKNMEKLGAKNPGFIGEEMDL